MAPDFTPGTNLLPLRAFGGTKPVKSKVTGNVNDCPAASLCLGKSDKEALYHEPLLFIAVMAVAMRAVHLTLWVDEFPICTSPKFSGDVQLNGRATGAP